MNGSMSPAGRDPLTDEALAEHLQRRGAEPAPRDLAAAIIARVEEIAPEQRWRLALRTWRPAAAALASAAALVLVASVLYFGPGGSAPGPTTWDPNDGPMTATQLAAVMDGWVPEDAGHVVVVDAKIDTTYSTHRGDPCENAFRLSGVYPCVVGTILVAARAINVTAFVPIADGAVSYPSFEPHLVLRLDSPEEATYITSFAGDGRPKSVRDSLTTGSIDLVKAWLTGQGAVSCPGPAQPLEDRTWDQQQMYPLGCPVAALVDRPVTMVGLTGSEPDVVRLQGGAYLEFAPDQVPLDSGNMTPRQGVFAVITHGRFCAAPPPDSSPDPRRCATYELAARLDPLRIPAPSTPTPTPSPTIAGLVWDPTQRPLTPAELVRILRGHPAPGTVLVVDDAIDPPPDGCAIGGTCTSGTLASTLGVNIVPASGGRLPFAQDGSPIPGPVAVRSVEGSSSLEFLGTVFRNGSGMAFRAGDLAARSATGGVFVVKSWIAAGLPAPCPSTIGAPVPTSEIGLPAPYIGCVPSAWLTDDSFTPINGSSPSIGLPVQTDAYDRFAPNPQHVGEQTTPREGVFLVRDWAGYGEVLARLDPLAIPEGEVGPTGSPAPTPTAAPDGSAAPVMSVDELLRRVADGSLAPGAIAVADIPASAVSDFWAPGVVHSCPQLCATWKLTAGDRTVTVDMFEGTQPIASIAGTQAFMVEQGGAIRALGPLANDGLVVHPADANADGSLWVVHGWVRLGITQPLPCPAPQRSTMTGLLQEPLAWSFCPGAWIAASGDRSSGPDGLVLSDVVPNGGIHVQDGAEDASFVAREGIWLARAVVVNQGPQKGFWGWELIGSVSPPAEPATSTPEPSPSPSETATAEATSVVWPLPSLVVAVSKSSIPSGSVVVTDVADSDLTPAFPPGDVHFCPLYCEEWILTAGGTHVKILLSNLWPKPTEHTGRLAFIVEDGSIRLLGPVTVGSGGSGLAPQAVQLATETYAVVDGWLRDGLPIPCPAPASPPPTITGLDQRSQLSYTCPGTWIQPTSADPRITYADGVESIGMPQGSVLVQDGADGSSQVARHGHYLVRRIDCTMPAPFGCQAKTDGPDRNELIGEVVPPPPTP